MHIFRALGTKEGSAHRMFPVKHYNDIKGSNQILPIFVLNLILVLVCIHSFFLDLTTYLLHGQWPWPKKFCTELDLIRTKFALDEKIGE